MTGQTIGRYEVERELGRGAMGAVFLCRDPYMGRRVAVKLMAADLLADAQFAKRFQREAQIVAALEHPCIVPVYDFGTEQDTPFIVMRHMSAGALDKYITQDPLPVTDAAQIVERVADALDEAHRRGIVHRDLKPGNILLDRQGQAYLGDFGLARLAAVTRSSLGQNYMVGTPAYMSPEQVMGDDPGPLSDNYALGVLLFELLSGRLPFEADNFMVMFRKHVDEPVPDLCALNPKLSPEVGAIVRRAMAKKPAERFASAGALADALSEAGRGVLSRRARKQWMKGEIDDKLEELQSEAD